MTIEVRCGVATDVGHVRSTNEDALLGGPVVYAVADGMGGHRAGDVAAALAIGALADLPAGAGLDDVVGAVRDANRRIRTEASRAEEREGMGTTVTGVCLGRDADRDVVVVFNVGDSRTYRWQPGRLEQITQDHSLVAELLRDGEITPDEAAVHPARNVVTRALGVEDDVTVDAWVELPEPGTTYVMCSDGLSNEVADAEVARILAATIDPQAVADALVSAALEVGAHDNVSVVVASVVAVDGDDGPAEDDTNPRGLALAAIRAVDPERAVPAPAAAELITDVPGAGADGGPEPSGGTTVRIEDVPSPAAAGGADLGGNSKEA